MTEAAAEGGIQPLHAGFRDGDAGSPRAKVEKHGGLTVRYGAVLEEEMSTFLSVGSRTLLVFHLIFFWLQSLLVLDYWRF